MIPPAFQPWALMVWPPSTGRLTPVTKDAALEAKNVIAAATSAADPMRPRAVWAAAWASPASETPSQVAVRIGNHRASNHANLRNGKGLSQR